MVNNQLAGPGNDFLHQRIIAYIVYDLMKKVVEVKAYKNFIVLPEFELKPDSAQTPDIAVWKTVKGVPSQSVLLIEICRTNMVNSDIKKLTELMSNIPTIKEAFIIDKDKLQINKIGRTKVGKPKAPKRESKSELFKIDLTNCLKRIPT